MAPGYTRPFPAVRAMSTAILAWSARARVSESPKAWANSNATAAPFFIAAGPFFLILLMALRTRERPIPPSPLKTKPSPSMLWNRDGRGEARFSFVSSQVISSQQSELTQALPANKASYKNVASQWGKSRLKEMLLYQNNDSI